MKFRLPATILVVALASASALAQIQPRGAGRGNSGSTPRQPNQPKNVDRQKPKAARKESEGDPIVKQIAFFGDFDAEFHQESGTYVHPRPDQDNTRTSWLYGPTVGMYMDFNRAGPIKFTSFKPATVGLTVRENIVRNAGYSRDSTLFGIRVAAREPLFHFKPYVEGSMGVGHVAIPNVPNYQNKLEYRGFIGMDRQFKKRIDWRVVEFGGGSLANYLPYAGSPQNNFIVTVSTGVVFRLK
jgi:hypothetical protein